MRQNSRTTGKMTETGNPQACLVIFCKRPALFQGKQRLARTIGADQTLVFARSFLSCALEDAKAWPGPVVLSPASPDDADWAGALLERDHQVLAQPDGGLGYRLQTIDQQLRSQGYDRIIFIGTDIPVLKAHHYDEARRALDDHDVVLSPASDGGVTIMGARTPWPDLQALPWSTDGLGRALENLCRQQGRRVKNISPSYDIDVEEDLRTLWKDLKEDRRPARRKLYQQLSDFLERNEIKYG